MCILFVYTLLKVVSHYDLSVLSVSVLGFQKNVDWVWGGLSSIQFFWIFLNYANPPMILSRRLCAGCRPDGVVLHIDEQ